VSTKDALAEGIAAVELRKLASRGALGRVGHGLYLDPTVPPSSLDQHALAVRLVGEDAYLMGDAVLARHNLALVNPTRITVGTPHRVWKALPALVRAVQRELPAQALTVEEGIAQTTVFQAIVDCMDEVVSPRLRDACPENDSFEAIVTVFLSSLSVRTWNSISAPRRSRAMYPSSSIHKKIHPAVAGDGLGQSLRRLGHGGGRVPGTQWVSALGRAPYRPGLAGTAQRSVDLAQEKMGGAIG